MRGVVSVLSGSRGMVSDFENPCLRSSRRGIRNRVTWIYMQVQIHTCMHVHKHMHTAHIGDMPSWNLMIPVGKLSIHICTHTSMFKHKSKHRNTHMHIHTHKQPNINTVLISVCLLLIQRANRRLCVLLSAKPVYTVWFTRLLHAAKTTPLTSFPTVLSSSVNQQTLNREYFNSWCNSSRPVSNSVCKNTLEGV